LPPGSFVAARCAASSTLAGRSVEPVERTTSVKAPSPRSLKRARRMSSPFSACEPGTLKRFVSSLPTFAAP